MGYIDNLLRGRKVEWKTLGEVAKIRNGKDYKHLSVGSIPVYGSGGVMRYVDTPIYDQPTVLIPRKGSLNNLFYVDSPFWNVDTIFYTEINRERIRPKFLYHYLSTLHLEGLNLAGGVPSLTQKTLNALPIPLPPLDVQEEIARILDRFTALEAALKAELEARQKQYEYYRDRLLTFDKTRTDVEWKALGEVAEYEQPSKYLVHSTKYNDSFPTPVLTAGKSFILGYTDESSGIYRASEAPIILFDDFTTASQWVDFNFKVKSSATKIITSRDEGVVLLKYIYYWLNTLPSECVEGDHKRRWISTFTIKKIPLPPLAEQDRIVRILDKFTALTTSLTAGLPREIALRRRQYEYYREQLLSFE